MQRSSGQVTSFRVLMGTALAGVLGLGAIAVAQAPAAQSKVVPDAQVEANLLKALAGAPDLANQAITTTTVYGVVTLSGSVETEALRTEAETIASRTAGVQKVVDELTLGAQSAGTPAGEPVAADAQGTNPMLQSDGTMAPAQGQAQAGQAQVGQGSPDSDNTQPAQSQAGNPQQGAPNQAGNPQSAPNQAGSGSGPYYGPGAPEYRHPYTPQQPGPSQAPAGPPQQQQGYGPPQPGYGPPQQQQGYGPPQPGYGPPQQAYNGVQQPGYGQLAGRAVTVPSGATMQIRINQSLDSGRTQPGTTFDGIIVNDIVADGVVAIPRGASIQGVVVDATKSGALKGRGSLSLQLTQVTLGGRSYPVVSDVWAHNGNDKTIETIDKTAIGSGVGAIFGAVVGGGTGAAIGAGVGAAAGLGSSAASGNGQVYIPSEGLLTFHLAQPAAVTTVSQQEMNRLAQGLPPGMQPQQLRRRYYAYPPPPYYGPVYYQPYPRPY
jgi:hypothetical protein